MARTVPLMRAAADSEKSIPETGAPAVTGIGVPVVAEGQMASQLIPL